MRYVMTIYFTDGGQRYSALRTAEGLTEWARPYGVDWTPDGPRDARREVGAGQVTAFRGEAVRAVTEWVTV